MNITVISVCITGVDRICWFWAHDCSQNDEDHGHSIVNGELAMTEICQNIINLDGNSTTQFHTTPHSGKWTCGKQWGEGNVTMHVIYLILDWYGEIKLNQCVSCRALHPLLRRGCGCIVTDLTELPTVSPPDRPTLEPDKTGQARDLISPGIDKLITVCSYFRLDYGLCHESLTVP
jgi:hypothetical protein